MVQHTPADTASCDALSLCTPDFPTSLCGFARADGRHGLRNRLLILYTVNCSSMAAREIADRLRLAGVDVDIAGNESCYDNQTVIDCMLRLGVHPNTGAVLIVGHGCEFIQTGPMLDTIKRHGRPAEAIYMQEGGTAAAIERGTRAAFDLVEKLKGLQKTPFPISELIIGILRMGESEILGGAAAVIAREYSSRGATVLIGAEELPEGQYDDDGLRELLEKNRLQRGLSGGRACPAREPLPLEPAEIRGALKIARLPSEAGIWVVDKTQDREHSRGMPRAGVSYDALMLSCCGAQLVCVLTDRGIAVDTVGAAVVRISDTAARSVDSDIMAAGASDNTGYQKLARAVAYKAVSGTTAADRAVWRENVLLRSLQDHVFNKC